VASLQREDAVRFHDGAQPVRDDDARRVERFQAPADDGLRLVIQGGGSFIEQEDTWPRGDGPGDHQSLPLASR
jgi:hypothetical protein